MGTSDGWADLYVATWRLDWSYGRGWGPLPFDAYGVDPAPDYVAYFRPFWDV